MFGYSMGGSVALQAAGAEPEHWSAVATIATFAVLDEAVGRSAAWEFGQRLSPLLHAMVRPVVRWRAGFDLREVSNPQAVSQAKGPGFLIVHGELDRFVPPDHARRIYAALPGQNKELMIVPEARHSDVLSSAAPVYATIAKNWLKYCRF
jgi:pimeloyl-ACP methyl ester carboxylesterase